MEESLGWVCKSGVSAIAEQIGVEPEEERQKVTRQSAHDEAFELDSDEDDGFTPSHYLTDETLDPAVITEKESFAGAQRRKLANGFTDLDARSREIVQRRWLTDSKTTLQELADQFGISAERVRQLEQNALKKLKLSFS